MKRKALLAITAIPLAAAAVVAVNSGDGSSTAPKYYNYACYNSLGVIESTRQGLTPQKCSNSKDRILVTEGTLYSTTTTTVPPTTTTIPPATTVAPTTTVPTTVQPSPGRITRQGLNLMLNGKQIKFAGVNANAMVYPSCRGNSSYPTNAELDRYFSELSNNNIHSLTRVWYLDSSPEHKAALARTVASAKKYNQYLTVALTDAASQCGDPIIKNASFWTSGFKGEYWTHVSEAVTTYKGDPTIAIWEIANEGNGGGNPNFYLDTAALIKSIDPDVLVNTGSMPAYAYSSQAAYEAAHSGPNIDFVSVHEYDATTGESHWATGAGVTAAQNLNKPVLTGEDGFCCGGGSTGTDAGNATKLTQEYAAYLNDPYGAGMLYWNFDFVNKNDTSDLYFGTQMWNAVRSIVNPWNAA
jgi:hypothetical protein